MPPPGAEDDDGLTREQWRRLVLVAVGIGLAVLGGVIAITAVGHFGGGDGGPPSAAFSVETVDQNGEVAANVTHAGGDGIHPGSTVLYVDDQRLGTWDDLEGEGVGVVRPGDSLVLEDVAAGSEVVVRWEHGDEQVVLGRGVLGGTADP